MKVDKSNIKIINKALRELAQRYELIWEFFEDTPSEYEAKIGDAVF